MRSEINRAKYPLRRIPKPIDKKVDAHQSKGEERLRSVFFASPDAIIITDLKGNLVDCNHAALELYGFSTKDELVGKNALQFICGKDRQDAIEKLRELIELGSVKNVEYTLLDKNGHQYPAEVSGSVIRDASGKPDALVAVFQDISERKKVEEALVESERKYRSVVDNIAIGVSVIGLNMEILALNKQMRDWFPDVDVSKKPICFQVFNNPPWKDVCSYCPTCKTLYDGKTHESITNTPKGDKIVNFRVISSPIKDKHGRVASAIEMVEDVTDRMRVQKDLKQYSEHLEEVVAERTRKLMESEEEIHSLFENVPDGIYRSSCDGKILAANPALMRMFGYDSLDDFLTIDIGRDLYVRREDREKWRKTLEKGGEIHNAELVLRRKNGQKLVVLENARVVRDEKGMILCYEGALTDITERKLLEERLSALNLYGGKLNAARSLDEAYELTLDVMEKTLGFGHASFAIERNGKLHFGHQRGYATPLDFELPLDGSKRGITVKAAVSRKSILVRDTGKDPDYAKSDRPNTPVARSELAVPVVTEDEVLGVLNVESEDLDAFDDKDSMLLEILGSHAATAINALKKRGELEKRNAQQASLMKSSAEMIRSTDLRQRLQAILDAIKGLGWRRVVLSLIDENLRMASPEDIVAAGLTEEERMYLWTSRKPGQVWMERFGPRFERFKIGEFYYLPWSDSFVREHFSQGIVESHLKPEEMVDWNPDDLLYAPLRLADGRIVGVVSIDDPTDGRRPTKESLRSLELFLHQGAVAIENARLIQQLDEANAQVQGYARELEVKVKERTKELVETQARLLKTERLAAIGEWAGMVGHDLRNPLTGIAGAAYYLKMKTNSKLSEKEKDMLLTIERAIDYSNKIISDLLEYSGEIKLDRSEIDPNSLLQEALSRIEAPAGITIVKETESEPRLKVDKEKMQRVFINIIKNAFDSMPKGGVLTIRSEKTENHVFFSFTDTGTGMSKETLQKLWTPLFTTKAKGMGFGLSICKRIAEAHGGKVTVESDVGKGTTIAITIPTKCAAEEEREVWVNIPESPSSTIVNRHEK